MTIGGAVPRRRQERPLLLKRTKREPKPGAARSLGDERKNVHMGVQGWAITPDLGRPQPRGAAHTLKQDEDKCLSELLNYIHQRGGWARCTSPRAPL